MRESNNFYLFYYNFVDMFYFALFVESKAVKQYFEKSESDVVFKW